ncbi:MAG: methionine--tRNA ligase [Phycisphaerales bacterium]|jgi:methionine--tRNA ligase|nr:methionine--tRNA ligase [Phycisphaerales bacterium]MDP6890897.1 methionine--tRNA ligase [Phycisphaerales bacterium]
MPNAHRYITTPIYYVNDRPHIGHVYTTTVCDIWARFQRLLGRDVFFLTGTDEHGQKVEQSAAERGMAPSVFADEISAEFRGAMDLFGLTHDEFIRTTDPQHEQQVRTFVGRLMESGDVYRGTFEGWYDAGQEEYLTETQAKEADYVSPVSGKPLERARQENYFFKLSGYQDRIEALFAEHPEFVRPEGRRNEVLGRLREGLQDVPISRTNFTWGIPVPDDESHVIYVWIDALFNYITALGLGDLSSSRAADRHEYWPATYQVIGKEILWFHAVIWPALLMALDLPMPRCVYAHSFWISDGKKMSKSLGNFIGLEQLQACMDTYGRDALRYFLAVQGPLGSTDADFSRSQFHETYTTDLVNTLGNCASRTSAMIGKYFEGICPPDTGECAGGGVEWETFTSEQVARSIAAMDRLDLAGSIEAAMSIVRRVDAFINDTAPFKLAKDQTKAAMVGTILHRCAEAIRIAACLLEAVLPDHVADLRTAWNFGESSGDLAAECRWGGLPARTVIEKVMLFPRIEA